MESPQSSERFTVARSNNVGDSVCHGVEVDAERQHKPVRGGAFGREPVRACTFSDWVLSMPSLANYYMIARRRREGLDIYA